eukprot:3469207-Prymnesium_polylepis.1
MVDALSGWFVDTCTHVTSTALNALQYQVRATLIVQPYRLPARMRADPSAPVSRRCGWGERVSNTNDQNAALSPQDQVRASLIAHDNRLPACMRTLSWTESGRGPQVHTSQTAGRRRHTDTPVAAQLLAYTICTCDMKETCCVPSVNGERTPP